VLWLLLYGAGLLLGLWLSVRRLARLRGQPVLDRWIGAALPLCLVVCAAFGVQALLDGPYRHWNAIRITPALSLFSGYTLYYRPDSGPVTGNIYTPLASLVYLPAAAASSPTGVIAVGTVISLLLYFAPVVWLYARLAAVPVRCWPIVGRICNPSGRMDGLQIRPTTGNAGADPLTRQAEWLTLALFPLLTYNLEKSLRYSAAFIHADAPALGMAAAAAAVLYVDPRHRWRSLFPSALLAVLAVWSKQVMAPLLLALPLWLLAAAGLRAGLRYGLALLLAGAAVLGVSLTLLDPANLFFNVVTIPGRHPWEGLFPNNLAWVALEFQNQAFVLALLLGFGALYPLAVRSGSWPGLSRWLTQNRWSLFLVVALLVLPTSLIGRMKVGGDLNALSFSLYFLLLAVCLMLREGVGSPAAAPVQAGFRLLAVVAVTGCGLLAIQTQGQRFLAMAASRPNTPELVVAYLKDHPGEAYFPWNPLGHLLAEGRYYHFEYGLFDRQIAGFPVREDHFRQAIPSRLRLVCVPRDFDCACALSHLKDFSRRVEVPELPGFVCYARADGAGPSLDGPAPSARAASSALPEP
jgi:hypothetical protein